MAMSRMRMDASTIVVIGFWRLLARIYKGRKRTLP
jgi:hypothetical protein